MTDLLPSVERAIREALINRGIRLHDSAIDVVAASVVREQQEHLARLRALLCIYADHQSWRCDHPDRWPWELDCPCGLIAALIDLGLYPDFTEAT